MQRRFRPVLVLLLLGLGACQPSGKHFELASGQLLEWQSLRGQWVLINYWAEWCKPCVTEIPELNHLARRQAELQVLGVNYDGITGEALSQQMRHLQIEFAVFAEDPSPQLGIARPQVLPTSVILDPRGEVVKVLVGPQSRISLMQTLADLRSSASSISP